MNQLIEQNKRRTELAQGQANEGESSSLVSAGSLKQVKD
jgi:hypothetical protein